MRDDDWEALAIRQIFYLKGEEWRMVYIEVNTVDEAKWITGHCRNMRRD